MLNSKGLIVLDNNNNNNNNNLGFSLYTILTVSYMVTISENWKKSKQKISTNIGVLLLNTRDQVQ